MSTAIDPAGVIAAAVLACPAVAGLHGGRFGQITTYLPGRRIAGVVVSAAEIVVGVVGRYPVPVAELAAQVRATITPLAPGVPVTVHVEDLLLPGETLPADDPGAAPGSHPPALSRSADSTPATTSRGGPVAAASVPAHPPLATPRTPLEKEHLP